MSSKTRTVISAGLLAVALGLGATAQASAGAPRGVSGRTSDNLTRIADFYGTYIDAVYDEDSGTLGTALRAHYLTPAFQKELNKWEQREHADGVLRAQNVPLAWKVTETGTKAGRTEAVVTLTWSRGVTSKVVVDMNASHKIFHIGAKGAGGK
ncbi:hypothetical protein [Streptomyces gilvus]|uniref:hypothetical protein n=1 Tax=Streptomyces gilvus TaxID=2920937 RepID=UPI001F0D0732|nr:hypothetical protein [Streptomyces sp. CME 23]MCH5670276.1 hypothetical protein [Streptomyces sp. CME 23]